MTTRKGKWFVCGVCGKEFYRSPASAKISRTCSKACQYSTARRPSGLTYIIKVKNRAWFKPGHDGGKNKGRVPKSFKGDEGSYSVIHQWVRRHYGKPGKCENCGATEDLHWANKSGEYHRVRDDWMRLCRLCHVRHDRKNGLWGMATKKYPKEFAR